MDKLPFITRFLKTLSDFFVSSWKTILIILITFVTVVVIYATTDQGKKRLSKMLMAFPLIGKMTKTYYLIKWARYMKLMIGSGLDYLQTFRLLRGVLAIPAYQEMLEKVMAGLQVGKTIYDALKEETQLIYPNVAVMIKV